MPLTTVISGWSPPATTAPSASTATCIPSRWLRLVSVWTGVVIDHWPGGCGAGMALGSLGMVCRIGETIAASTAVGETTSTTLAIPPPMRITSPGLAAANTGWSAVKVTFCEMLRTSVTPEPVGSLTTA